jgi:hypothetical protein
MREDAVANVGITHETAKFAVEGIRRWRACWGGRRTRKPDTG